MAVHDPIVYLTDALRKMTADRDRWLNVAGIMHEYLQEGDPDGARERYEQECLPRG